MTRRHFLAASAGAACASLLEASAAPGDEAKARELYELRLYHFKTDEKQAQHETFLQQAALPAFRRAGAGPIGVFAPTAVAEPPKTTYLLIRHPNPLSVVTLEARLQADAAYREAGTAFLQAPAADPAFVRIESMLLTAFAGFPRLAVPPGAADNRPRLFELRTYESHSKAANLKKIEMFNRGEIAIFRRAGLDAVFFGETLIGPKLPNLTYMLVYDDMAAHDRAWRAFGGDPEWQKLRATPGYQDKEIVSAISSTFLRPLACSQI